MFSKGGLDNKISSNKRNDKIKPLKFVKGSLNFS